MWPNFVNPTWHWNRVFQVSTISKNWSSSFPCIMGMMTSSNGNIFRVTGPLCGEFTGPVNSPHKGQWRGALIFSLICVWINSWVNNREAGDLRRHRSHYDVNVMVYVGIISCRSAKCPVALWTWRYPFFAIHIYIYIWLIWGEHHCS